ncbi:metallophosphoesterase [Candidatus Saccharibacteria bacterium]|nr:metallophosphoesterase [Candidatus Saccharibacteria bacterium]
MKLVVFADIHYLDDEHTEETGRKLTWLAVPLVEKLASEVEKIKPDACFCLGDFIEDTENHDIDAANLRYIWSKLTKFPKPLFAVPGNHDLRTLENEEIAEIMGTNHQTFSTDLGGYHFVCLWPEKNANIPDTAGSTFKTQYISQKDLDWLKQDLQDSQKPSLVFLHFGLANDEMRDHFWFAHDSERAVVANREDVKKILRQHNVLAVFSGHQHWTKHLREDGIDYYVVGSITEDIDGQGIPDGVYFEVDLDGDNVKATEKHVRL